MSTEILLPIGARKDCVQQVRRPYGDPDSPAHPPLPCVCCEQYLKLSTMLPAAGQPLVTCLLLSFSVSRVYRLCCTVAHADLSCSLL